MMAENRAGVLAQAVVSETDHKYETKECYLIMRKIIFMTRYTVRFIIIVVFFYVAIFNYNFLSCVFQIY